MPLDRARTVTFSVPVDEAPTPQEIDRLIMQMGRRYSMVARQWIPQTMGDCVWLWYEFETKVRAVEFILALSGVYYKYETRLSQAVLDDWADVGYSEHHAWL